MPFTNSYITSTFYDSATRKRVKIAMVVMKGVAGAGEVHGEVRLGQV